MGLTNAWVKVASRIPEVFSKIRDGQAPERFTQQLLQDWGFPTKNDRAFIPLLKALGFLTPEGKPTQRYNDYRDHSRSQVVLGQALKEAYGDLFLINENPSETDRGVIQGKFKSFHNTSDDTAALMTKTFLGLLKLADLKPSSSPSKSESTGVKIEHQQDEKGASGFSSVASVGLHYNIQIHLPATKDTEVYNAIFKSLRAHLVEG